MTRGALVPARVFPSNRAEIEKSIAGLRHRGFTVVLLPDRRRRWIRVDVAFERHFDAFPQWIAEAGCPGDGKRGRICLRRMPHNGNERDFLASFQQNERS